MDPELLISLAPITKGKLLERRKEINRALVRAGVSNFNLNRIFNLRDLSMKIQTIANTRLEDEIIISVLEELCTEEYLVHVSDLNYRPKKKLENISFQDLTMPIYAEFIEFLKNKYEDYDPYIDKNIGDILSKILLEIAVKFINSQETKIESLPIENFRFILEEQALSNGIKWKDKFVEIFFEYFESKPPKLLEFIFDIYSSSVNMKLILKEQEMPEIHLVDEVGFLLVDTSFLVALMCKTDPTHALALAVAMQCEKRHVPLYYLDITKQELNRLIHGSKLEMAGLVVEGDPKVIRSQFVRDYNERLRIEEYFPWSEYYAEISDWEIVLKLKWEISAFTSNYEIDGETYEIAKLYLPKLDQERIFKRRCIDPSYNKPARDEQQIHHDAVCLASIANVKNDPDEKSPIGPWFLTFDNLVFRLSEIYLQIDEQKSNLAIQPRTWLNYLLIFSKMEFNKEDRDTIAEAILIFTTRDPDKKITLDEYSRLIAEKLSLRKDDAKLIKELFLKSPLNAELIRALELGHGGDADRAAQAIINNKDFIELLIKERGTAENLKRVALKLRDTDIQLREERAARKALERNAGYNIYIKTEVKTTIDVNLETQINGLLSLLKAQLPEGFEKNGLPEPPKGDTHLTKIKGWLTDLKETIDTSKGVADGVKALVPYITSLIGLVSQYT